MSTLTRGDAVEDTLSTRFARLITEVFAPAVLVVANSLIVAWHSGSLLWGIFVAVLASLIPLSYVVRGVRRGHYTDKHLVVREQRRVPMLVGLVCVVAVLIVIVAFGAPRDLMALVAAMLAGLVVTLPVTYWWKVSVHTAVAAGMVTTLVVVFGAWLNVAWVIAAAVAWSRVRLRVHTVGQVITGALLGAGTTLAVFPWLR